MKINNLKNISILDCTLRDGGYYTNWQFDNALVSEYLSLCARSSIDVIELGYLRFNNSYKNSFANVPDSLPVEISKEISKFDQLNIAVMIDAKEFANGAPGIITNKIQNRLKKSLFPINLLRIAMHFSQVQLWKEHVCSLIENNFSICINLMQIELATPKEVDECIAHLAKIPGLKVVYLADSLGSFLPNKVKLLIKLFANKLKCQIGFHAHDNRGLALYNSLLALNSGATWIDSTIYGMGRGSGNAKSEQLLPLIRPDLPQTINEEFHRLIAKHFYQIQKKHKWGSNAFYSIAGMYGIHPTYVQYCEANRDLSVENKLSIIYYLVNKKASSFSQEMLEEALKYA
jgi:4-hydroxy 2-oxovalerate aldolase